MLSTRVGHRLLGSARRGRRRHRSIRTMASVFTGLKEPPPACFRKWPLLCSPRSRSFIFQPFALNHFLLANTLPNSIIVLELWMKFICHSAAQILGVHVGQEIFSHKCCEDLIHYLYPPPVCCTPHLSALSIGPATSSAVKFLS